MRIACFVCIHKIFEVDVTLYYLLIELFGFSLLRTICCQKIYYFKTILLSSFNNRGKIRFCQSQNAQNFIFNMSVIQLTKITFSIQYIGIDDRISIIIISDIFIVVSVMCLYAVEYIVCKIFQQRFLTEQYVIILQSRTNFSLHEPTSLNQI